MDRKTPASIDELLAAASRIVEQGIGSVVVDVRWLNVGVMTFKCLVTTETDRRYIVRFYPEGRQAVVQFEPDLLQLLRSKNCKVPFPIVDSRSGPAAPLAYVAYEYIVGRTLLEQSGALESTKIRAVLAAALTLTTEGLWTQQVRGFGDLVDSTQAHASTWRHWLNDSFETILRLPHLLSDLPKDMELLLAAAHTRCRRFDPPNVATLAWGDMSGENILVSATGELLALIDFEAVLAAEPALQFGYYYSRYAGTRLGECLPESKQYGVGTDRVHLYSAIRGLRLLAHYDEPLPTGIARSPVNQILPGWLSSMTFLAQLHANDYGAGRLK